MRKKIPTVEHDRKEEKVFQSLIYYSLRGDVCTIIVRVWEPRYDLTLAHVYVRAMLLARTS